MATNMDLPRGIIAVDTPTSDEVCAICLDPLTAPTVKADCTCGPLYHYECLDHWLKQRPTCPICKNTPGGFEDGETEGSDDHEALRNDLDLIQQFRDNLMDHMLDSWFQFRGARTALARYASAEIADEEFLEFGLNYREIRNRNIDFTQSPEYVLAAEFLTTVAVPSGRLWCPDEVTLKMYLAVGINIIYQAARANHRDWTHNEKVMFRRILTALSCATFRAVMAADDDEGYSLPDAIASNLRSILEESARADGSMHVFAAMSLPEYSPARLINNGTVGDYNRLICLMAYCVHQAGDVNMSREARGRHRRGLRIDFPEIDWRNDLE